MNVAALDRLSATWRDEGALFRRRGAESHALLFESLADDLDRTVREWLDEPLRLEEAAHESGYSVSRLGHMVGDTLPNVGVRGSPRVRRADLPRKPGRSPTNGGEPDLAAEVLSRRLGA